MKTLLNLSNIHNESEAVKEAAAFYTAFSVTATNCTAAERERHYDTLEQAGYIEKVGVVSNENNLYEDSILHT